MTELLIPLMKEYQRLMKIEDEYLKWKEENPDKGSWEYKGQRVSKTRFKRIGTIIRQTMNDFERGIK